MVRKLLAAVFYLTVIFGGCGSVLAAAPCGTGVTTCTTDTAQDKALVTAINDPDVQQRVYFLWVGQCLGVQNELVSTVGHLKRAALCNSVSAGLVSRVLLVAAILNATTEGEILSQSAGCPSNNAGCLVDADVVTAIGTALTVTVSSALTTATAIIGSTSLTVASATGVVPGMEVHGPGIPSGVTIPDGGVSGTTVALNAATTAALSVTPVLFTISSGLPTRAWP